VALLFLGVMAGPVVAQTPTTPGAEKPPAPPTGTPSTGSSAQPIRLEPSVTTATRTERSVEDIPVPVDVIPPQEIKATPARTADDLIRNIPGTNLSRGSSQVTHPTGQSVGLRGIGSNRALVLIDGVPLNDAFGGWVNWSKAPLGNVDQIEVIKGGGSALYGTYAMGGVINILTKVPDARALEVEAGFGTMDSKRFNVYAAEVLGDGALSLNFNHFETDGWKVIPERLRGPIDEEAFSDNQSANLKFDHRLTPTLRLSTSLTAFNQDMNVGTPLTNNSRESLDGSASVIAGLDEWGDLRFTLFTGWQEFRNSNSRIGPNRASETIALRQYLPTFDIGGSVQWTKHVSEFWDFISVGIDARRIWGENNEKLYGTTFATAGRFLRRRDTEATQFAGGVFADVIMKPVPAWQLQVTARGDYWKSYDAVRLEGGFPTQEFEDQEHMTINPKIATRYQLADWVAVRAAAYKAIRFPTINEMYRGFFSGNISFEGNPNLGPEELWGAEAGVDLAFLENRALTVKITPFYNYIVDLITSVTKTATLRMRENAATAESRGIEFDSAYQVSKDLAVTLAYVFTDSRFVDFYRDRALDGKRVPNVAKHQVSTGLRYSNPWLGTVALRGRFLSNQFGDDRNLDELDSHFVMDASITREVVKGIEAFAFAENVTDERYFASRSGAIGNLAAPFSFMGGVRVKFY
jgi:outer membrane receptor protein involved in Fe transport